MSISKTTFFYQPLIAQDDRLIRLPIEAWQQTMAQNLIQLLREQNADLSKIAPPLNQLALLDAYQNKNDHALILCDAQIKFWKMLSQKTGDKKYLCLTVQPWINIIRLDRWQNKVDNSASLYQELAPKNRSEPNSLSKHYELGLNFNAFCELNPKNLPIDLLNNVYWAEYGRQLFISGADLALQTHIQSGLNSALNNNLQQTLLELLFSYQSKIGKDEKVLLMLGKMNIPEHRRYWLHFKVMEMALHFKIGSSEAPDLSDKVYRTLISGNAIKRTGYGLYLLFEITKVFKQLALQEQEIHLLQIAKDLASELNDEVILFEIMYRQSELQLMRREEVLEKFQSSRYSFVRKKLNIAPLKPSEHSDTIVTAVRQLAELNFDGCLRTLENKFEPENQLIAA